jgi:lipoprotein-releasing system permease protein
MFLKIVFRYLFGGRFTTKFLTVISFLGTFLATSALLITVGVMNGFEQSVKENLLKYLPHALIFAGDPKEAKELSENLKREFPKYIENTYWYASFGLILQKGENLSEATVYGMKEKTLKRFLNQRGKLVEGTFSKNSLILGEILSTKLGIFEVPAKVIAISPFAKKTPIGFLPNIKRMSVGAIFRSGYYPYDSAAFADYDFLIKKFAPSGYYVVAELKDPYGAEEFKKAFTERYRYFFITTWIDTNKDFFNALKLEKLGMFLVVALITVVSAFNITALLLTKVKELSLDFAVFRAFGLGRGFIFSIVVSIGGTIGIFGSLSGILFSLLVSFVVNKYKLIKVPADVYLTPYLPIVFGLKEILLVFFFVVSFSLLASLIPATVAVKQKVSEVLRNS